MDLQFLPQLTFSDNESLHCLNYNKDYNLKFCDIFDDQNFN